MNIKIHNKRLFSGFSRKSTTSGNKVLRNISKRILTSVVIGIHATCCYAAEVAPSPKFDFQSITEEQHRALLAHTAYIDIAIQMNNVIAREQDEWYSTQKYRDSVINQIAYAIAHKISGCYKYDNSNIVIFEGTDIKNYTQANYNAWILYNYIDKCFQQLELYSYYGYDDFKEYASYIKDIYKKDIDIDKFDAAVEQINKYINIPMVEQLIKFYCKQTNTKMSHDNPLMVPHFKCEVDKKNNVKYIYDGSQEGKEEDNECRLYITQSWDIYISNPSFCVFAKNLKNLICIEKRDIDLSMFSFKFTGDAMNFTRDAMKFTQYDFARDICAFRAETKPKTYKRVMETLRSICSSNLMVNKDEITDYINWGEHPNNTYLGRAIELDSVFVDDEYLERGEHDNVTKDPSQAHMEIVGTLAYEYKDKKYINTYNKSYPYQPLKIDDLNDE